MVAVGIARRMTEHGFSPNRLAVLGVNLILLVSLPWSAVLYPKCEDERRSVVSNDGRRMPCPWIRRGNRGNRFPAGVAFLRRI
jgi:hypothetical protein